MKCLSFSPVVPVSTHQFSLPRFPGHRFTLRPAALNVLALLSLGVAADSPPRLDAVNVTATRLPAVSADQPVNLSVLSREDIARSSATRLPELLQQLAGVHVRSLDSSGNATIDLRGFGANAAANTLILLDGIRLNDNDLSTPRLAGIALEAIERIEIVRGGSVAFGSGTTGGVIQIFTRPEGTAPRAAITAKAGSDHLRELSARLHLPVGAGYLGLQGRDFDTDGYRDNSGNHNRSASVSAGWRGQTAQFSAQINHETEDARFAGVRRVNPVTGLNEFRDNPRGTNSPDDHGETDITRALLRGEGEWSGGRWVVDVTHSDKSTEGFFDFGGGFTSADRRESDDLRLAPRLALSHSLFGLAGELALGLDYARSEFERYTGARQPVDRVGEGRLTTRALWLDEGLRLSPATRITLGLRRESSRQRSQELQFDGSLAVADRKDHSTAWQLGLRQQLATPLSLYAKGGRSFRLPNADELVTNADLQPQRSQDLEAGLEWRQTGFDARLALYRSALEQEIAFQPYVNGFGQNINLNPTRRQGLELEGRWRWGQADVGANLSFQDARFRSGEYGGFDVGDKRVPLVPRWLANVNGGWAFSPQTRLDAYWRLVAASRLDNDQPNTAPELAGFGTVDLKLSHRRETWELALSGQNLGDKQYASYGVRSTFGPNYNLYPNPERRWLASFSARF